MTSKYYHEGDGIIRERKKDNLPESAISLTDFRRGIVKAMLTFSERKSYDVYNHGRPLCRVILEPL